MGDIFAGDVGVGFLVSDKRGSAETAISDETAAKIVRTVEGETTGELGRPNLFEISAEEFESFRGPEVAGLDLPQGMEVWQVKK